MLFEILTLFFTILLPPGTGASRVAGFDRNNFFSPREKRQYAGNNCPCVSQFTPVNCKCRGINGGAELICRCDRAAVFSSADCGNCPPNPGQQSSMPPPSSVVTHHIVPPATNFASTTCQPICRQNCMKTCNTNQIPSMGSQQSGYSYPQAAPAIQPGCQPSQCHFSCQRACASVQPPMMQNNVHPGSMPLSNHQSFSSYSNSPGFGTTAQRPSNNVLGSAAVCNCPPEEDFCTCQQCYPICAENCEMSCAEPQLVQSCVPMCRANCLKTCGENGNMPNAHFQQNIPQQFQQRPNPGFSGISSQQGQPDMGEGDTESNEANCYVKCPESCERACNNLQGSSASNCQPACVSMCSQSCKQHEEALRQHSPQHENITDSQNSAIQTTTTESTTEVTSSSAPEPTTPSPGSSVPPLPLSMDEPMACAPLCQPECLKSCTSKYLEPQTYNPPLQPMPQPMSQLNRGMGSNKQNFMRGGAENDFGENLDGRGKSHLLDVSRQRADTFVSMRKPPIAPESERNAIIPNFVPPIPMQFSIPPQPRLVADPGNIAPDNDEYFISEPARGSMIVQPQNVFYPNMVQRPNVAFFDDFMLRRKFNRLKSYQNQNNQSPLSSVNNAPSPAVVMHSPPKMTNLPGKSEESAGMSWKSYVENITKQKDLMDIGAAGTKPNDIKIETGNTENSSW
ncbi:hypothetical protein Ddc_19343 [Ditylenchus destructor]|nr:hypothetical protein Ddc_19343 [Ditylenchus destructor]